MEADAFRSAVLKFGCNEMIDVAIREAERPTISVLFRKSYVVAGR